MKPKDDTIYEISNKLGGGICHIFIDNKSTIDLS